jgi:hypothetical protein
MTEAALYLMSRSARNWGLGLVRRLKSPRYFLAVLFGLAYLGLALLGQRRGAAGPVPPEMVTAGGTILLAILLAKWWLFGADRLALAFTPAEIHFLFPAPVRRSALLAYKLFRAQRLVILNVLVWAVLLRQGNRSGPGGLAYGLALWVFFSTVAFHRLGVALTRESVIEHGRSGLRRAWPALAAIILTGGCLWLTIDRIPSSLLTANPNGPLGAVQTVLDTPPLAWLVWPLRITLLPMAAETTREWAFAFSAALGLAVLHVFWIVRADRSFEEAAIEASARRAELLERWQKQGAPTASTARSARRRLPLAAAGHPVAAIVWKNLTRLARTVSPALILTLAAFMAAAVVFVFLEGRDDPHLSRAIPALALGWAAVLGVLGPQWVRVDIRGDLGHLTSLKTWPLSGLTLMTGQVFSSVAVLTLLQAVLIGLGLGAAVADGSLSVSTRLLLVSAVPAVLLLGSLNAVSLCIQNGAAILYPAWVRTEIRPGGIEQMGQHLLTAGASFLLLLLASAGPAVVATGVVYYLWPLVGPWAVVPGMLAGAAGLALEGFLLLDWLGRLFERLDPSQV